jgi:Transglutaminase-like superfamily
VRVLALPGRDQAFLVRALVTLLGVQLALRVASIERLKSWASHVGSGTEPSERVVWAVRAAARRLPGCTCLVSALALQRLLSRQGHVSELHVGVAKQGEKFAAHAWVTCGGQLLIGETDGETYVPLLAWKSGPR